MTIVLVFLRRGQTLDALPKVTLDAIDEDLYEADFGVALYEGEPRLEAMPVILLTPRPGHFTPGPHDVIRWMPSVPDVSYWRKQAPRG